MIRRIATISAILGLLFAIGCGVDQAHSNDHNDIRTINSAPTTITVSGMSPAFTVGEMYQLADLIVQGSPTTSRVIQRKPASSEGYPEHLKELHADWVDNIRLISFRVDEYIKGESSDVIEIVSEIDHDKSMLEDDATYILYLREPLNKEYWENSYRTIWDQGVWQVEEVEGVDVARQALSVDGDSMTVQELVNSRTGSPLSDMLKKWDEEDRKAAE